LYPPGSVDEQKAAGIVRASAGNHAKGVCYAAKKQY